MTESNHNEHMRLAHGAALADEGAQRFVALAGEAISARGRFSVALAGGNTPRALYERLARPPLRDAIDWARVHVFWSDERFVPLNDSESNFRMARETLLAHVTIPAEQIYPAPTLIETPEAAAQAYSETITAVFSGAPPRFDLILLGMGADGHTASLFPGHPEVVAPSELLVAAVYHAPKPPTTRLTFTYRTINAAAHVIFLVAGADKQATLRQVLNGPLDVARLPAQGVRPEQGKLVWLAEAAAM